MAYTGERAPGRQYNSAQRLAALWRTLTVPDPVRAALAESGRPVLLVDDRIETGWTVTVAAGLLRECGASAVLPLALAVTTCPGLRTVLRGGVPHRVAVACVRITQYVA